MGQRTARQSAVTPELLKVSVFATPLGYWGILGTDETVYGLTLGQSSAAAARAAFVSPFAGVVIEQKVVDWNPRLRQRLERYAAGESVAFDDVPLHLPNFTPFQQQIIAVTRSLPYGETITYGELAARANHPRAARAVGSVMSSNRIPIIIPCHRVLAAGGKIGGYSAPQGISLKSRLLELEREPH